VCERADVSRGALLHHFPTRVSLMVAAVDHLARAPLDQLDDALAQTAPREQIEVFLSWLWGTATGDLFAVGLELLTAARTEPQLQGVLRTGGSVLQQRLATTVRGIVAANDAPVGGALETSLLIAIPAIRGIGLDLAIGGDRQTHFTQWKRFIEKLSTKLRSNFGLDPLDAEGKR
jgi:AcrR family transcriptional regulator